MNDRIAITPPAPDLRKKTGRALIECGVWLRIGFIGACAFAAGLRQLFDGEVKPLSALMLAVGGGALAAFGWWRGRTVLDNVDGAAATAGSSSLASPARTESSSWPSSPQGGRRSRTDADHGIAATQPEATA
jgi:hypothetical protein